MALERQQAGGQANAEEDLDSLNQLESSYVDYRDKLCCSVVHRHLDLF